MRCCFCGFAAVELDRGLDDLLLLVLLPEAVFPGGLRSPEAGFAKDLGHAEHGVIAAQFAPGQFYKSDG